MRRLFFLVKDKVPHALWDVLEHVMCASPWESSDQSRLNEGSSLLYLKQKRL